MKKKVNYPKPRGKCAKKKLKKKKSYEVEEILSLIGLTSNNLNESEKKFLKKKILKRIINK